MTGLAVPRGSCEELHIVQRHTESTELKDEHTDMSCGMATTLKMGKKVREGSASFNTR